MSKPRSHATTCALPRTISRSCSATLHRHSMSLKLIEVSFRPLVRRCSASALGYTAPARAQIVANSAHGSPHSSTAPSALRPAQHHRIACCPSCWSDWRQFSPAGLSMALFVLRASGDSVVLSALCADICNLLSAVFSTSASAAVSKSALSSVVALSELFTPTVSETLRRGVILFVAASRGRHRAPASSSLLINLFAAQIGLLQHLLATHIPTVICVAGSRLSIGLRICNHPPLLNCLSPATILAGSLSAGSAGPGGTSGVSSLM